MYQTPMCGILLSLLGWCPQLPLGFVRQATKTDMQDCWSLTCCPWLNVVMWPASVFFIGTGLVDVLQNRLNWFHFFFLEGGPLVFLIDCVIFLSPFLDVTRMSMSVVCFFAQLNSGILCLLNAVF